MVGITAVALGAVLWMVVPYANSIDPVETEAVRAALTSLPSSAWIRIRVDGSFHFGKILEVDPTRVTLHRWQTGPRPPADPTFTVFLPDIEKIEWRRRATWKGVAVGSVLGFGLGYAGGASVDDECSDTQREIFEDEPWICGGAAEMSAIAGAATGALIGAVVGSAIPDWKTIYVGEAP